MSKPDKCKHDLPKNCGCMACYMDKAARRKASESIRKYAENLGW